MDSLASQVFYFEYQLRLPVLHTSLCTRILLETQFIFQLLPVWTRTFNELMDSGRSVVCFRHWSPWNDGGVTGEPWRRLPMSAIIRLPAIRPLSLEQWRLSPPKCLAQLWKKKIVDPKRKWLEFSRTLFFISYLEFWLMLRLFHDKGQWTEKFLLH
jgi:hypothetical protein